MNFLKRLSGIVVLTSLGLWSAGPANAVPYSGTFNASQYDTFTFSLASNSFFDIFSTGGYGDPTISLFNASGTHLITNDDSNGLFSHLSQNLSAGSYTIMMGPCCSFIYGMNAAGGGYYNLGTDGFNSGSYYFPNSPVTLAQITAHMTDGGVYAAGASYSVEINAQPNTGVPEPASLALLGLALAGLGFSRRRKQAVAA